MLGSLTGGGGLSATGGAAGSGASGQFSEQYRGGNAGISVSPVGVNFGEILQPFKDTPENGGYGLLTASRMMYKNAGKGGLTKFASENSGLLMAGGMAVAVLAGFFLLRKRR